MQYKKEVKLQHLTVVQHQKVYDTQRSKMKHMHVNCIKNIILKKKKGRIVQQQKCIVRHGLQSKIKTNKRYFLFQKGNGRVVLVQYKKEVKLQQLTIVQHQKVHDTQRSKMKYMHVNCIICIILKK